MVEIKVKYLGIPSITIDNEQITFPYSKAENIMYMLMYERVVTREVLSTLFWGDMDEPIAKKNLRNAIYIIRKHTLEDIITSSKRNILQLNEDYHISSDIDIINSINPCEALNNKDIEYILKLYDGDFLEEVKGRSDLEFVEWIDGHSYKIKNIFINKLRLMTEAFIQDKDYFNSEMCCRKMIELEEYDESAYTNLMKIYFIQNRYEEAITIYNNLVEKLYTDLSVKPSKETDEIYEAIINNIKINTSKNSTFFYGREKEKKEIYDNIYNFIGNKPFKSLLICGEDGIGKSMLLNDVNKDFDVNLLKIKISCLEYENNFIFKFWDKAFQQISDDINIRELNIPKNLIDSINKIFPTLNIETEQSIENLYSPSKYNMTENAIFDLFNLLTQKFRIMFIVDDLQLVDKASLELLYKVMLSNRYKIMLIATNRDEKENNNEKFFYSLKGNNAIKTIHLERFSKLETEGFLKSMMPEATSQLDRIYSESEGNPLFIIEMTNSIKNGNNDWYMTNKIENLIESRLINLSNQASNLLSICSLFHGVFNIEILVKVMDIKALELIDIVDELLTKGILIEESDSIGLSFSHRKIREYVYNNLSNSKRVILHEKIGEYYEGQISNDRNNLRTLYSELIHHFRSSNNKMKLFKYKIRRLECILNTGHEIFPNVEVTEAANFFQYYLDNESLEKEFSELKILYEELICCKNANLKEEEIIYLYLYGRFNKSNGNYENGLIYLNKMVKLCEVNNYYDYALSGYLQIIHYYVNINDLASMSNAINKAENITRFLKDECKTAIVLRAKGYCKILSGKYEDGRKYLKKAIDIFNSSVNREKYILNIVASLFYIGEGYRIQGNYIDAMKYYNRGIDLCDENEEFPAVALIFSKIGYIKYKQGDMDTAQFYYLKSIKAYEKSIFVWGRADVYYYLSKIYEFKNNTIKSKMYLDKSLEFIEKYSSKEVKDSIYKIIKTSN